MRTLILILLFVYSQAEAQFFFKRKQASIPIPPRELSFKQSPEIKIPTCDHLDQISCIMDNTPRFYPDKSREQLIDLEVKMIVKTYSYLNKHLTESQIQDAFVQGHLMYESLKKRDIEIHSVEKWQRYFVGEAVISALNAHYSIN